MVLIIYQILVKTFAFKTVIFLLLFLLQKNQENIFEKEIPWRSYIINKDDLCLRKSVIQADSVHSEGESELKATKQVFKKSIMILMKTFD